MTTSDRSPREAILDRIRSALRDRPEGEPLEAVEIPRHYETLSKLSPAARVDQFAERVEDYRATVTRVGGDGLAAAIASTCERRGIRRLVVPEDLPDDWIPRSVEILRGNQGQEACNFDPGDGVLTGCSLGVAQTGTIVLDGGPRQGFRRISLLPDYHLCVVEERQIVGTVAEALQSLRDAASRPDRPMTWISGPSATSDIELNRVEGVHGPRTLEVLIVS